MHKDIKQEHISKIFFIFKINKFLRLNGLNGFREAFLLNIFCAAFFSGTAQDLLNPAYLSAEGGFSRHIIVENGSLSDKGIKSLDLSYGKSLDGRADEWVRFIRAKYIQYNFVYMDLRDLHGIEDTVRNGLGHHFGLNAALQIQVFRINRLAGYLFPGMGVSYLSSTYFTDRQNRFIGSHLNYLIRVEYSMFYRISSRSAISAAMRAIHFSNGGFRVPNAGINSLGVKAGFIYYLNEK